MDSRDLVERVFAFTRGLIPPGANLLIAVSGGGDSVALYHVLQALRMRLGIGRLGVAHVNHGLRGDESDGDEALVGAMARIDGAVVHVKRLDGLAIDMPGMEARAREERYRFFAELRAAEGYDLVATGHTADDQAETVIMRLRRGCGLRGLAGIHALRDDGVVRPLLTVGRDELRAWLTERGLPFREDSSNSDCRFGRNRVRHGVLQALRSADPSFVSRVADTALGVQAELRGLAPIINKWIDAHVVFESPDCVLISTSGIAQAWLPREALVEVLRRANVAHTRKHIEALVAAVGKTSGVLLLAGGWRCRIERDCLSLTRGLTSATAPEELSWRLKVPGITECGTRARFDVSVDEVERNADVRSKDNLKVVLDAGKLGDELWYRPWKPGELFWPFGRRCAIPVNGFLKKQGLPKSARERTWVVARADGEIVWIPGVRTSQRVAVDSGTMRVARFSCTFSDVNIV